MNTEEARRYLTPKGQKLLSKRSLQRYAEKGLLTVTYVEHEGTRSVADYDEQELKALKESMSKPKEPSAQQSTAMTTRRGAGAEELAALITQSFSAALEEHERRRRKNPEPVALETLPILTPPQAAAVSGLTENFIRANLDALKAKKIGRGYKINRANLDAFVKRLFKSEGKGSNEYKRQRKRTA